MKQLLTLVIAISAICGLALAAVPMRTAYADAPIVFFIPVSAPQLSSDTIIMFLNPTGNIAAADGCSTDVLAEQRVIIIVPGEGATSTFALIKRVIDQSGDFVQEPLPIRSQLSSIKGGESTCSIYGVEYREYTANH